MNDPTPTWVAGAGMICAVGRQAMPAAAAIDAGVVRLQTTSNPGDSMSLHPVAVVPGITGSIHERVDELLVEAIKSCGPEVPVHERENDRLLVYLGWADARRPGAARCPSRGDVVERLGPLLDIELDRDDVHVMRGDTAGMRALVLASARLREDTGVDKCLVCAADSWIDAQALTWLGSRRRSMTPGEAGVALWLSRAPEGSLAVRLLGSGVSSAADSCGGPMALALMRATQHALDEAGVAFDDLDLRVSDVGTLPSEYGEHTLAAARMRVRPKPGYRALEPARQIGSAGAAAGLINVVVASYMVARRRRSLALCTASSDFGARVAVVLGGGPREPSTREGAHPPWAL